MRHLRIQERTEALNPEMAKIIKCLVLVQLKKTTPDITEQEGTLGPSIAPMNPGT